ncbi:hypothetical protein A1D22_08685 [Pasteurellaceae bacterium LFhippo2]|nr:hypothetical protein [Pasteurellaceae bacterium LFhippo2]
MSNTELFLHTDKQTSNLAKIYKKAISEAIELYIVSAYLTEWDSDFSFNTKLYPSKFKFIFGKDFGISKKIAINKVYETLPKQFRKNFLVAENIQGFHPKAMFWKTKENQYFSLIGSSNLTNAAFNSNYEANILNPISEKQFIDVIKWITDIEKNSTPITAEWIENYIESISIKVKQPFNYFKMLANLTINENLLTHRRKQLENYQKNKDKLKIYIQQCSDGKIDNEIFYGKLKSILENGITFQPRFGWVRKGRYDNFKRLCQSLINIYNAPDNKKDKVVSKEINKLQKKNIATRKALLSELLSLEYPDKYPLWNSPVIKFIRELSIKIPSKSDDGEKFILISNELRKIINDMDNKFNLAELDVLIQHKYR